MTSRVIFGNVSDEAHVPSRVPRTFPGWEQFAPTVVSITADRYPIYETKVGAVGGFIILVPQDWVSHRGDVDRAYDWLANQVATIPEVVLVRVALRDEVRDLLIVLAAEDFYEAECRVIPIVRQLITSFPRLSFDFLVAPQEGLDGSGLSAWPQVIYERSAVG